MNYILTRTVRCNIGTYFPITTYSDINEAFKWCEVYNVSCCIFNCGCKFIVEETILGTLQPLVFNQTNTYIPYTYTYTPSYTYTPYNYYNNSPLWYSTPTSTSTASTSTFTITI